MTLLYFILVLGVTVFIHELGHFIFAKRAGIYVYEFALGMGPKLFKFKRKNDETVYSIRLLPIGGYVQMAGEEIEVDDNIPMDRRMQSKGWWQRFLTIIAGVLFNFILAIILLFTVAMINGAPESKPYIGVIDSNYPIAQTELQSGDLITKINGIKVGSVDRLVLELQINTGKEINIQTKDSSGNIKNVKVSPVKEEIDGTEYYRYGFSLSNDIDKGIIPSIKYAFVKTGNLIEQMFLIIGALVTGKLSLNNLAGPVGIFNIVGESAKAGFVNLIYLIGFLSINVGFINLLPIPAFDGGRLLFLIIEKIMRKPINPKVENIIHTVGFVFLMSLMIIITYNDILCLFK
jgi:regulator of sigma E protease